MVETHLELLGKVGFSQQLEGEGLAPRSVQSYLKLFGQLEREVKGPEKENLNRYLRKHKGGIYYGALLHYCKWKYGADISDIVKYKRVNASKPPALTVEQLKCLVDDIEGKLAQRERVIIKLNLATGRRISEILNLRGRQIDWAESRISFKTSKGGMDVNFKINPGLMRELKEYIEDSALLATDELFYPNKPYSKNKEDSKYNQYIRALKKAGVSPECCRTHNFRRAVINYLITKKGVEYASAFVGHECIETTMKYLADETRQRLIHEAAEVMADE